MPPQLEKTHVVPTSWQDEALARHGVSREAPCSALKGETVPDSLPVENPMDGGAWYAAVHGVAKSQTRLFDFTFSFHFHAMDKKAETNPLRLVTHGVHDGSSMWSMSPRMYAISHQIIPKKSHVTV